MTICPVSLTIGCQKCLVVKLCPLKTFLGNYKSRENNDRRTVLTYVDPFTGYENVLPSQKDEKYTGQEKRRGNRRD